jgi:(p)ppGpp synthase/HD superfamily hydrolase
MRARFDSGSPRFLDALTFASHLHRAQTRKHTDIPYVSHLLSVAGLVIEYGGSEDEAIAALLHDAVEDQGGEATLATIHDRFGERVAAIVSACTDSTEQPKPPWRPRKEAYLAHIRTADAGARLVSASDKLHNARAIVSDLRAHGAEVWQRFSASPRDVLWYYRGLVNAFVAAGGPARVVEELDRTVREMEASV